MTKPRHPFPRWILLRKYWPFAAIAGLLLALLLFSYPYLRQERAVAWARSKGGSVQVIRPNWLSENLFPEAQKWLSAKRGGAGFVAYPFAYTGMLNLGETDITDDDMYRLEHFLGVELLFLHETAITDASLEPLERYSELKTLFLLETGVTDAGLVHLEKLSNLMLVNLEGTKVTEEGANRLRKALPGCVIKVK